MYLAHQDGGSWQNDFRSGKEVQEGGACSQPLQRMLALNSPRYFCKPCHSARPPTQVWLIRNGPPKADSSTEEKLAFYKYFKQATEGDVQGSQPWAVQDGSSRGAGVKCLAPTHPNHIASESESACCGVPHVALPCPPARSRAV